MFMFLASSIFAEDKVTSWNDILKANEATTLDKPTVMTKRFQRFDHEAYQWTTNGSTSKVQAQAYRKVTIRHIQLIIRSLQTNPYEQNPTTTKTRLSQRHLQFHEPGAIADAHDGLGSGFKGLAFPHAGTANVHHPLPGAVTTTTSRLLLRGQPIPAAHPVDVVAGLGGTE